MWAKIFKYTCKCGRLCVETKIFCRRRKYGVSKIHLKSQSTDAETWLPQFWGSWEVLASASSGSRPSVDLPVCSCFHARPGWEMLEREEHFYLLCLHWKTLRSAGWTSEERLKKFWPYVGGKDAKYTKWGNKCIYCKMLGCHRWLFVIVILRLKPTWNLQVYSHKSSFKR